MDVSKSHDPFLPDSEVEEIVAEAETVAEEIADELAEGVAKTTRKGKTDAAS